MTVEMGKEYTTRDGRAVRIYAVCCGGDYPVHGATWRDGVWCPDSWTSEGRFINYEGYNKFDLIEVKPKVKYSKSIRQLLNEYPSSLFDVAGNLCVTGDGGSPVGLIPHNSLWRFTGHITEDANTNPRLIEERDE